MVSTSSDYELSTEATFMSNNTVSCTLYLSMLYHCTLQDSQRANSFVSGQVNEVDKAADTPVAGRKPCNHSCNQQPVDYTIFVSAPKDQKQQDDPPTNDSNPNQVRYAWGKDEQQNMSQYNS